MMARIAFRLRPMKDRKRYPVICRVSMRYSTLHEGARKYKDIEFTTGVILPPEEWERWGLKTCTDQVHINSTIERIYDRCRLITEEMRGREFDGVRVSLDEGREKFATDETLLRLRGKQERRTLTAGVLEWISSKNDNDLTTEGTKRSRRNTINHLSIPRSHCSEYTAMLGSIYGWICRGLSQLACNKRGLNSVTTNKQMKTLSTFFAWGKEAGKAITPVKISKLKEDKGGGKMYLSSEAIDALCALELEKGERDARDWFVIACGTGVRVGDLLSLTTDNLVPVAGKGWQFPTHRTPQYLKDHKGNSKTGRPKCTYRGDARRNR